MKHIFLFALILGTQPVHATSMEYVDSFEDTAEFSSPTEADLAVEEAETTFGAGRGYDQWSYAFVLIRPNGSEVTLSEHNRHALLKPASTIKLFTGYWAMKRRFQLSYLGRMLKTSNNNMAQTTINRLGGPANMRQYYAGLGLHVGAFHPADGSGLSYSNQTSCDFQVRFLSLVRRSEGYQTFRNLLAQPGAYGTLDRRLLDLSGRVFAKTGTLNRTANLSGFLETSSGTVVFCATGDYLSTSVASARQKIDQLVRSNFRKSRSR